MAGDVDATLHVLGEIAGKAASAYDLLLSLSGLILTFGGFEQAGWLVHAFYL